MTCHPQRSRAICSCFARRLPSTKIGRSWFLAFGNLGPYDSNPIVFSQTARALPSAHPSPGGSHVPTHAATHPRRAPVLPGSASALHPLACRAPVPSVPSRTPSKPHSPSREIESPQSAHPQPSASVPARRRTPDSPPVPKRLRPPGFRRSEDAQNVREAARNT